MMFTVSWGTVFCSRSGDDVRGSSARQKSVGWTNTVSRMVMNKSRHRGCPFREQAHSHRFCARHHIREHRKTIVGAGLLAKAPAQPTNYPRPPPAIRQHNTHGESFNETSHRPEGPRIGRNFQIPTPAQAPHAPTGSDSPQQNAPPTPAHNPPAENHPAKHPAQTP